MKVVRIVFVQVTIIVLVHLVSKAENEKQAGETEKHVQVDARSVIELEEELLNALSATMRMKYYFLSPLNNKMI